MLIRLVAAVGLSLEVGACRRAPTEPRAQTVAAADDVVVTMAEGAGDVVVEPGAPDQAWAQVPEPERVHCAKAYGLPIFAPADDLESPNLRENSEAIIAASERCPPRSAAERAALALAYGVGGFNDEALGHADHAVRLAADDPANLLARAVVRVWRDEEVEAEADLRRVLELDAGNWTALLELGLLLDRRGDPGAARGAFERAVAANPKYILGHFHLAQSLLSAGDLVAAEPHCEAVLAELFEADMALCSGLASARQGDLAGALAHLEHFASHSTELADAHEVELERALRDAYLAAKRPVEAARHTCLAGDGDGDECDDPEVEAAVEELRSAARAQATEGSYAVAAGVSASRFAAELQRQAKAATGLDDLVHPEIGVFVFNNTGEWSLSRSRSWPAVPEADPELTLARLRSVGRLPKRLGWEKNELDCSYPLDGIGKVSESEGLSAYHPTGTGAHDLYRLCGYQEYVDSWGEGLDAAAFTQMQRAALAVSHVVVFSRERFEFGKIGARWVLLAVAINYDPEDDACG